MKYLSAPRRFSKLEYQFLKFGLTTEALQSYVPLFEGEFYQYIDQSEAFQGFEGSISVTQVMAELTIYMASRTLQGKRSSREVQLELR